nr:integrase, catalytic region, zinc finger, CCHC-type, peptidase aspartic, catalytic [Tanacetum cinerariifolium]
MVAEDDEMSKDKKIDKLMALITLSFKKIYKPTNNNLRTSSNTSRANQDNSPRINRGAGYDNQSLGNVVGARENVEQADWKDDTDDESEDQELEAYYMYMAQIQEVSPDAADFGPIFDTEPVQKRLNEEMVADLRYFNSLESEVDSLTSQLETQKTQFVNEIDRLSREYLYADHMNAILGVYTELDEVTNLQCNYLELLQKCECLETELSKSKKMSKSFESVPQHAINLELELQQCQEKVKHDMSFKVNKSKDFCKEREQYFEIQDLKAQLQDKGIAISELKKLIEKLKGKYVDTKFEKSSVIRQSNDFKSPRPSVLGKPTTFSNSFIRKDFSKSTSDLKAQLQDKSIAISELKKLIEKLKGKYVDTKFEKSSVIRQPNAFKSQRPSILGKPTIFSDSLKRKEFSKSKSVTKKNMSNDFSKPVTVQILPPNKQSILKNTNVLALGMYQLHTKPTQTRTSQLPNDSRKTNKRVSFSTGVIPTTSVSRPRLKSNPMEDRVMLNNSQGKKQEVEDHRRNVKFSKNKTFVTACNDSLNAKTLNVTFVCATCGKCVLNEKHDMCVLKSVNGVNYRTKIPIVMPLVEIILFIIDSRCSKYMTGYLKLLIDFVEKFLGTVKFRNDQIAPILGYGDLVQGAVMIQRVYYVKGLNHNLFFVGQFCDADLEVAFRKSTCYIRDLKGNDLLTGSRRTDLYSITLHDTTSPNPICLMAKATSSQAWLWHRRLSHLNFDTINLLSKNDIVIGLPKLKFVKDHLCSS